MKSSTFETVRLNTATLYPWSFMFRTRFCPMTASPIKPMSQLPFSMNHLQIVVLHRTCQFFVPPQVFHRSVSDGGSARLADPSSTIYGKRIAPACLAVLSELCSFRGNRNARVAATGRGNRLDRLEEIKSNSRPASLHWRYLRAYVRDISRLPNVCLEFPAEAIFVGNLRLSILNCLSPHSLRNGETEFPRIRK